MFWLKLGLIGLIAWLWFLGGQKRSWARDALIPVIVGGYYAFAVNWLFGLLLFGAAQIIRMGYGAFDPINDDKPSFWASVTHDRNGWWIRLIVGACYGISVTSVILFFYHDPASAVKAGIYTSQNAAIGFLVSRLRLGVLATDLILGASFASLFFWF